MAAPKYAVGFQSLEHEGVLDEVPVRGAIPAWLSGDLMRVTPAKFEVGQQHYRHWFDGLAMLHRFGIHAGRVSYANAFIQSRSYSEAEERGRISRGEFGTDPCLSIFGRIRSVFAPRRTDNTNVNVIRWAADRYAALTETPLPMAFDRETLATLGNLPLAPNLNGQIGSAHPHYDFTRRRMFTHQIQLGRKNRYVFYTVSDSTPRGEMLGAVETDRPAYMHSFGMTERYLLLVEFPLVVSPLQLLLSGLLKTPFIENYRWRPERGTRFWVVDKNDGRVVTRAEAEPCFAFHHVNAFERGDEIVADIVIHEDAAVIQNLYLDRLRSGSATVIGKLRRFRIPLKGGPIVIEPLSEEGLELPRVNYGRYGAQPYRFLYGAGCRVPGNFLDQLVKYDLETSTARTWYEEDCHPGEPVFVAAPDHAHEDGVREDGGLILSVVLDGRSSRSFLLVLDAETWTERARAEVPHPIPFGFHGQFFGET